MVRIGFIRWFVEVERKPMNGGRTELSVRLIPQAKQYRALVKEFAGVRSSLVEKDIELQSVVYRQIEDSFGLNAAKTIGILRDLARSIASDTVQMCLNRGIVDYENYDKRAAEYIVSCAIMRAVETDAKDEIESVESIDLIADMRALREERHRQEEEQARLRQEAWEAHNAEAVARAKVRDESTKTSFELLYSMLNAAERHEAETKGQVTVKNLSGEFVVPVSAHGLVKQYIEGEYKASYCIVFQDWNLPLGDETLMKIALLKTNPDRFFKVANKFIETGHRRRMVARD